MLSLNYIKNVNSSKDKKLNQMQLKLICTLFLTFNVSIFFSQSQNARINSLERKVDSLFSVIENFKIDSDKDGLPDLWDTCSDTPLGARIDGSGCPLDTDEDGIIDLYDKCVVTPGSSESDGCEPIIFEGLEINDFPKIEFEYLENNLTCQNKAFLDELISIIDKYGENKLFVLEVHSNDFNSEKRNMKIAKTRADKIYQYISNKNPTILNRIEFKILGNSSLLYIECQNRNDCVEKCENWKNVANNGVRVFIKDN